ncbi:hypothetical protein [Sporomusa malonica]|uniref:Uncharacterized protein n=1 Tax=Sporomusa malonica TaxID=112901 RepID=A0A1W2EED4_9FIRM|nr:hypothetical protein [Sporomusa malonica]SMD08120.1 hypothetical protein SAMN04488500_12388 [Sporomusa malonica]
MKTTIKYAHGKGFSKNLSSITVLSGPRTNHEIQENIIKARPQRRTNGQAHQAF